MPFWDEAPEVWQQQQEQESLPPDFRLPDEQTARRDRFMALLDQLASERMAPNRPQGFLDRFALGLQSNPMPQMQGGTPLASFASGLMGGASRGFAQNRIRERGLGPPDLSGRMELLKLMESGAEQEGRDNTSRVMRAVQMARVGKMAPKAPAKALPGSPEWRAQYDAETQAEIDRKRAGIRAGVEKDPTKSDKAEAKPKDTSYARQSAMNAISAVRGVLPKINNWTAGPGSVLSKIPGTPAADVKSQLLEVTSNAAFQALAEMRAASKTGGALGAISDKENDLLAAVQGSTKQDQSPENLKRGLRKIEASMQRMANALALDEGQSLPFPGAPAWDYNGEEADASNGPAKASPAAGGFVRMVNAQGKPFRVPAGKSQQEAEARGWKVVQ